MLVYITELVDLEFFDRLSSRTETKTNVNRHSDLYVNRPRLLHKKSETTAHRKKLSFRWLWDSL